MIGNRRTLAIRLNSVFTFVPIEGIRWSIIVEKARSEVLRSEYSYLVLIGVIGLLMYAVFVLSLVHLRDRHRDIKELEKLNEELKARTELSGGTFRVESAKGRGTTARASWEV